MVGILKQLAESAKNVIDGRRAEQHEDFSSGFELSEVDWSEWEDTVTAAGFEDEQHPQAEAAAAISRQLPVPHRRTRQLPRASIEVREVAWSEWEQAHRCE